MNTVTHLFIKRTEGSPVGSVAAFEFGTEGIKGNTPCLPLRHVLLMPSSTLIAFNVAPGFLRENIVIEFSGLHELPSGTILEVGEARIRLTFHCESCGKISQHVNLKTIAHQRGYLGAFLNSGCVKVGDRVIVKQSAFEEIPFNPTERIRWYLSNHPAQIRSVDLLKQIGFGPTYCRILPKWLGTLEPGLRAFVRFGSRDSAT